MCDTSETTNRKEIMKTCEEVEQPQTTESQTEATAAPRLTELISGWNTARLKSRLKTCRKSRIRLATRRPAGTQS